MYRLLGARRGKQGTFVVIIYAILALREKCLLDI